ncbi:MAG: hypothetical protein JKY93_11710, partial [Gammaproteobacteria bacterium]|nr:hypothetical protein [Gammaproteobacteria bacterium]
MGKQCRAFITSTLIAVLILLLGSYASTVQAAAPSSLTNYQVGSLVGQLSIDQGSASYSVPISVPPGVAGMQPELSFNYTSQGGNGLLGMGWSLGGQSQVSRCPKTQAQDGVRGRVYYDQRDRFCLDGQRLIAVNGSYGAAGTEYRTELDSHSRIISYGQAGSGPEKFKVWTKAGQTIEFAYTADSSLDAVTSLTVQAGTVLAWYSNRIRDAVGNPLDFVYHKDTLAGEHWLEKITYTINQVLFNYEDRQDKRAGHYRGSRTQQHQRLSSVEVWAGNDKVSQYDLGYNYAALGGASQLVELKQSDANGNSLPPIRFAWGGGSSAPEFEPYTLWLPHLSGQHSENYVQGRNSSGVYSDLRDMNG